MKLAVVVLSIFVAFSQQQFHPRMAFAGFPWLAPEDQQGEISMVKYSSITKYQVIKHLAN